MVCLSVFRVCFIDTRAISVEFPLECFNMQLVSNYDKTHKISSCSIRHGFTSDDIQYIPRNMHTVFALLCFVVVIHWLIFPSPSGLLHWHCGNLTIAPVPAKQPWWIWINTSCEFIMNDCITTTKQSTTKPCAYFLGYTVDHRRIHASPEQNCTLPHSMTVERYLYVFVFI